MLSPLFYDFLPRNLFLTFAGKSDFAVGSLADLHTLFGALAGSCFHGLSLL
jgi:hypothetical protein